MASLAGQPGVESAGDIDGCEFGVFVFAVCGQLVSLPVQICALGVGLGADGHIFTGRHGHCPSHQPGYAGDQHAAAAGFGCGHADDQTGSGNNAVVGSEHGGPEPADAVGAMRFSVFHNGCFLLK